MVTKCFFSLLFQSVLLEHQAKGSQQTFATKCLLIHTNINDLNIFLNFLSGWIKYLYLSIHPSISKLPTPQYHWAHYVQEGGPSLHCLLNTCRVSCRFAILVLNRIVRRRISQKDLQDLEVAGKCVAEEPLWCPCRAAGVGAHCLVFSVTDARVSV